MTTTSKKLKQKTELSRVADKTGQRFGLLTVREFAGIHSGKAYWLCDCVCGGSRTVRSNDLCMGRTKSCGCRGETLKHVERPDPVAPKRTPLHAIFYNPEDRRAGR